MEPSDSETSSAQQPACSTSQHSCQRSCAAHMSRNRACPHTHMHYHSGSEMHACSNQQNQPQRPRRCHPQIACRNAAVLTALLCIALSASGTSGARDAPCLYKKIGILDLAELAKEEGVVGCNLEELVHVNLDNGVVYLKSHKAGPRMGSHQFGIHAGPWYLYQTIKNSRMYTPDIGQANIIYVHTYCYYTWWLATIHTKGKPAVTDYTPGTPLLNLLRIMTFLERWRHNEGRRDFVFYDPHPGFIDGRAANPYNDLICNVLQDSTHLIPEHSLRSKCKTFPYMRTLSVPFVPNMPHQPRTGGKDLPLPTIGDRKTLVYFQGKCLPDDDWFVSMAMRRAAIRAIPSAPDVAVSCTDMALGPEGGKQLKFADLLEKMEGSVFCLVFAGDTAATRRTGEVYMAGCIPVFVGPPFATAPLPTSVNYTASSVWVNVTRYGDWLKQPMHWDLEPDEYQTEPWGPHYWFPEAIVPPDQWKQVDDVADIVRVLREIPNEEVQARLNAVAAQRHLFQFRRQLGGRKPAATGAILQAICTANDFF